MESLIWEITTLLFQGIAAGIIVVIFTQTLDRQKANQITKGYAIAVSIEIGQHLEIIEALINEPHMPPQLTPFEFDTWCWHSALPHFALLQKTHLVSISNYYRSLWGFNEAIDVTNEHVLTPIQISYLKTCLKNGRTCLKILGEYDPRMRSTLKARVASLCQKLRLLILRYKK